VRRHVSNLSILALGVCFVTAMTYAVSARVVWQLDEAAEKHFIGGDFFGLPVFLKCPAATNSKCDTCTKFGVCQVLAVPIKIHGIEISNCSGWFPTLQKKGEGHLGCENADKAIKRCFFQCDVSACVNNARLPGFGYPGPCGRWELPQCLYQGAMAKPPCIPGDCGVVPLSSCAGNWTCAD